jgi:hypothetical protein
MTQQREIETRLAEASSIAVMLRALDPNGMGAALVGARLGGLRTALDALAPPALQATPEEVDELDRIAAAAGDDTLFGAPHPAPAEEGQAQALDPSPDEPAAPPEPIAPTAADPVPPRPTVPELLSAEPPAVAKRVAKPAKWTEERKQVLRDLYPKGASGEEIAAAVNALPGEPATPNQCLIQAGANMGLRRSTTAPAPDPLAGLEPDEITEAESILRSNRGARGLAEWFGWELPRAQAIAEALRARQAARDAA